jgi:alpha-D-xyloside xylohydrolase
MDSRTTPPFMVATALLLAATVHAAANQPPPLLNEPVDISPDFREFRNTYFLADHLAQFDPETGAGQLAWKRSVYRTRQAFDNMLARLQPVDGNEFPTGEYAVDPVLPFSIQFVSPRALRIRLKTGLPARPETESLMLLKEPAPDHSWRLETVEGGYRYTGEGGSVTVLRDPFHVELRDPSGRLLTRTNHDQDNRSTYTTVMPFAFVRRASDYSRSVAPAFSLAPGEKLFGCGESFTRLNKRGQKVVLFVDDANGVQNPGMYKPIPFFMSSRGYGMFVHSSTPMTFDFGASFDGVSSLMIGDDELDLFVFLGTPKQILGEYTSITGKAAMPPLWSFGLWMSRITYFSEQEVREVADKLRENRVPSDVIHLDTGWFETDWRCDYEFSKTRFKDPARMMSDLKQQGFHVSLWQLPYFVPKNRLFPEIVGKHLAVRDARGNLPYEDAVLDFSNPEAVSWYQDKIAGLLKLGVGAIKVDFGEAAPLSGLYASGRTGFYEHNLYPLRYNRAVAEVTKKVTGETIIWARSTWAGSQRYPLHWAGDPATTDTAMAATLRGGLSLGLSGFTFWSHDMGGFTTRSPEELYRRWAAFGMLTSHSRSHGEPPTEPWEFGEAFLRDYRRAVEMKYRLMPYVYAQAKDSSERGLPMLRALFVEFPEDPGSWQIEDEYLLGSDMLVAPLLEKGTSGREVYLPPGSWIDYQTATRYPGGWHRIEAGEIPIVVLVRDGAVIPHIALAQSTMQMDWSKLELRPFVSEADHATGLVCLPSDQVLHRLSVVKKDGAMRLLENPLAGRVSFSIR